MVQDAEVIQKSLPWVEKYRPKSLEDLISHKDIITTIQRFIKEDKLPHLLFYGPAGTGKTSTILAVARQLYSEKEFKSMVLELNASDDRGIGVVREQILTFASTRTIFKSKFKLVILDEADAMTNDAQNALRRVMEKFTENTRFCLICNYLTHIIPAIQSRCTRFRFGPLDTEQMQSRLQHVIETEGMERMNLNEIANELPDCNKQGINSVLKSTGLGWSSLGRIDPGRTCNTSYFVSVTEDGMKSLIRLANGDMRKSLNILQSTSMAFDIVNEDNVYTCTGQPLRSDITSIIEWMLNENFTTAYNNISKLKTLKGLALQDILTEVHTYVHRKEFIQEKSEGCKPIPMINSYESEQCSLPLRSNYYPVDFPEHVRIILLQKMADVEYRLAFGTSEKMQLSSLIAAFQAVRDLAAAEAKEV